MAFDNVCKTLAEQYPDCFAGWLLGFDRSDASEIQVLKTELSLEPMSRCGHIPPAQQPDSAPGIPNHS